MKHVSSSLTTVVAGPLLVCFPSVAVGAALHVADRSFNKASMTARQFAEMGVHERCFFAANTLNSLGRPYCDYPSFWLGVGQYDFAALDRQIADIRSDDPQA